MRAQMAVAHMCFAAGRCRPSGSSFVTRSASRRARHLAVGEFFMFERDLKTEDQPEARPGRAASSQGSAVRQQQPPLPANRCVSCCIRSTLHGPAALSSREEEPFPSGPTTRRRPSSRASAGNLRHSPVPLRCSRPSSRNSSRAAARNGRWKFSRLRARLSESRAVPDTSEATPPRRSPRRDSGRSSTTTCRPGTVGGALGARSNSRRHPGFRPGSTKCSRRTGRSACCTSRALAFVGELMRAPGPYYRVNVAGTAQCAGCLPQAHGAPSPAFSSTCAVYGCRSSIPTAELMPTRPISPYGAVELMVERLLEGLRVGVRSAPGRASILQRRGRGSRRRARRGRAWRHTSSRCASDATLGGARRSISTVSDYPTPDGTAIRDYVHVSDLADAHGRRPRVASRRRPFAQDQSGNRARASVREVLGTVAAVAGRPVPHQISARRRGDLPELVADPGEALAFLGQAVIRRSSLRKIIELAWAWHTRCPLTDGESLRPSSR